MQKTMDKNLIQIVKEFSTFFGKKLDTIANKDSIGVELKGVSVVTIKGDRGEKGEPGKNGVDGKDSSVIGPQGERGERGIPGEDGKSVMGPQGPQGERGADGESVTGPRGKDGKSGTDGSPDTPEEIIQKINKSNTLIHKDKIEGLDEFETMARTADANTRSFMNTGSYVYSYDLSASLDGVTKTFTLPANARVIMVFASSTPGVFRPTTDYTTTASTITFTSEISAASTLATGQTVIILYKIL